MLLNFFKIAIRHIRKEKFYAIINISGLSLGIAFAFLILVYAYDEFQYDKFHHNADSVYRINTYWGDNPNQDIYASSPAPLHDAIKDEIPEVEEVARALWWNDTTMRLPKDEKKKNQQEVVFRETKVFIVDPNFLKVLDFNIIEGSPETAFEINEALVLTKNTAIRYFGEEALAKGEIMGKQILFGNSQTPRTITAIVDPPANTHFHFDMLVNINFGYKWMTEVDNWSWNFLHTYIKINEQAANDELKLAEIQEKLNYIADNYGRPYMDFRGRAASNAQTFDYVMQAVTDIHLHSHFLREIEANGNSTVVYILVVSALLLLLIACVNFINLSTARAFKRATEIGVKKVLGSGKNKLITQFLFESILMSWIACIIALGLIEAFRIPFNSLTSKFIEFNWFENFYLLGSILSLSTIIGLIAGTYPAFYLTKFQPVVVLKSKNFVGQAGKGNTMRNMLVIFQFSISTCLIICTLLVYQQLDYLSSKNPGFDRENVLIIKNDKEIAESWKDFKAALNQFHFVQKASFTTGIPTQQLTIMRDFREETAEQGTGFNWFLVDDSFIPTLQLEMALGRNFDEAILSDKKAIILNESAAKILGVEESPLGKIIIKNKGADDEEKLEIVGILKDFNIESLHHQIKPLAFQYYQPKALSDFVIVRLNKGNAQEYISQIENVWKQFEPQNPFIYSFMDEQFDAMFKQEQRLGNVLGIFTGLTIFIACLGVFGLVSYTAQQRTKEIGIRKVLGASVTDVIFLLSSHFTKIIFMSICIAIPISYLLISSWLEGFAFKTDITWWIFPLSGIMALLLSWAVTGFQSFRAAKTNPIHSLKDE